MWVLCVYGHGDGVTDGDGGMDRSRDESNAGRRTLLGGGGEPSYERSVAAAI
jgi:hypothetical protein